MNKRIIIIAVSLITLSVSGAILYRVAPEVFSKVFANDSETKKKKDPLPARHHNDGLKADFIKIADYYKASEMSFIQTITKYDAAGEAVEKQTLSVFKGKDYYLSESADQIMMCNATVSLLVDKPRGTIYMDSAWDMKALMPYTDNMLELLGSFEKIEKKALEGDLIQYKIQANINGVEYTLLTVDGKSGAIQTMEIFGDYQNPDGSMKKGKTVISYSTYSSEPETSKDKLNEKNYIKGKGKMLKGVKAYKGYTVLSKNNIYE